MSGKKLYTVSDAWWIWVIGMIAGFVCGLIMGGKL